MDVLPQVLPLAILDSISVATLAIPVWFLLTPRGLRIRNVVYYLVIVGVLYFFLGVLLIGVLAQVRDSLSAALDTSGGDVAVTVAGIALIIAGVWHGRRRTTGSGEGRLMRWRAAAVGESARPSGVVTVALIAVALEVVTMFPYLSAIETLGREGIPQIEQFAVLAIYCAVMIAPALLATAVRSVSQTVSQRVLSRIDLWLKENAQENTAWLLGIVGIVLQSNTALFQWGLDQVSST